MKIDEAQKALDSGFINKKEFAAFALQDGAITPEEYSQMYGEDVSSSTPAEQPLPKFTMQMPPVAPPIRKDALEDLTITPPSTEAEFSPAQLEDVKATKEGQSVMYPEQGSVISRYAGGLPDYVPPPSGREKAVDVPMPERIARGVAGTAAEMVSGTGQAAQLYGGQLEKGAEKFQK